MARREGDYGYLKVTNLLSSIRGYSVSKGMESTIPIVPLKWLGVGHIIPSLNCIAIVWSIGPGRRSRPRPWEQGCKPANFFTFIGVTFFILRVARFFVGSDNIRRCPKTFWRHYKEFHLAQTQEYKATLTSLLKKDKSIIHIDFSFLSLVLVSLNN